jgi:hypothetical protein
MIDIYVLGEEGLSAFREGYDVRPVSYGGASRTTGFNKVVPVPASRAPWYLLLVNRNQHEQVAVNFDVSW